MSVYYNHGREPVLAAFTMADMQDMLEDRAEFGRRRGSRDKFGRKKRLSSQVKSGIKSGLRRADEGAASAVAAAPGAARRAGAAIKSGAGRAAGLAKRGAGAALSFANNHKAAIAGGIAAAGLGAAALKRYGGAGMAAGKAAYSDVYAANRNRAGHDKAAAWGNRAAVNTGVRAAGAMARSDAGRVANAVRGSVSAVSGLRPRRK